MTTSRRRGAELLAAIYAAVLAELADKGYAGLTMEGVAARAGTGKAPLYRRWSGRDDLVLDTVRHGISLHPAPPYSGDVRADLLNLLRRMAFGFDTPMGAVLRTLLGETHRSPALLEALHEAVFDPRATELRALLRAAAADGEIRDDVVDTAAATLAPELLMFRFLTQGLPLPAELITEIVDDIALPLLRPPKSAGHTMAPLDG